MGLNFGKGDSSPEITIEPLREISIMLKVKNKLKFILMQDVNERKKKILDMFKTKQEKA